MAELSAAAAPSPEGERPARGPGDGISDVLDSTEAGGRIIRGGVLRFATYVAMVALSVLSAALLTRHLGVVRFGEYTTVLSLVGIVASITDAGMSTVGTREFAVSAGAERDALMRDLLGLRMTLTACGVVLVTAFALAAGYSTALLAGAVLASLGTIALVVQHTHTIPLTAALRLGTLSALELARQVLTVGAIVALVVVGAGVAPLLAVTLAVNLVLIPPTARLARHQISLRMSVRPRQWLALLRLTVAFSLATAVGTIYIFTAQILTSLIASPHQSGLFAASFRIFMVMGAVPGVVVGGALPLLARAARDDRERLSYALQRIFEASLILGVAAALGIAGRRAVHHPRGRRREVRGGRRRAADPGDGADRLVRARRLELRAAVAEALPGAAAGEPGGVRGELLGDDRAGELRRGQGGGHRHRCRRVRARARLAARARLSPPRVAPAARGSCSRWCRRPRRRWCSRCSRACRRSSGRRSRWACTRC